MLRRFPGALRLLKIKDEDYAACYEQILQALAFSLAFLKNKDHLEGEKEALDHSALYFSENQYCYTAAAFAARNLAYSSAEPSVIHQWYPVHIPYVSPM